MRKIAIMANNTHQRHLKTSKKTKNKLYNIYCQYFSVSARHVASRQFLKVISEYSLSPFRIHDQSCDRHWLHSHAQ